MFHGSQRVRVAISVLMNPATLTHTRIARLRSLGRQRKLLVVGGALTKNVLGVMGGGRCLRHDCQYGREMVTMLLKPKTITYRFKFKPHSPTGERSVPQRGNRHVSMQRGLSFIITAFLKHVAHIALFHGPVVGATAYRVVVASTQTLHNYAAIAVRHDCWDC